MTRMDVFEAVAADRITSAEGAYIAFLEDDAAYHRKWSYVWLAHALAGWAVAILYVLKVLP